MTVFNHMNRHEPVLDAHRPGHSLGCLRLCALSGIPHRFTIGSFAKSPSNSKGAARIVRYHQNQIVVPFITAPHFSTRHSRHVCARTVPEDNDRRRIPQPTEISISLINLTDFDGAVPDGPDDGS
jgi:hypothetical protein